MGKKCNTERLVHKVDGSSEASTWIRLLGIYTRHGRKKVPGKTTIETKRDLFIDQNN